MTAPPAASAPARADIAGGGLALAASSLMTPLGIAALKAREGVRLRAYLDSVGVPTIGYGHTRGVRLGQTVTQAQADAFFLDDLASHALPILSCIAVPVADHERDALISIAFNIGVGAFRRSGFLRLLNAGDRAGAAEAILAWRKPPEILPRRQAEYDQFRTPYSVMPPRARSSDARAVSALPDARRRTGAGRSLPTRPVAVPNSSEAASRSGALVRLWARLRQGLTA